MTGRGDLVNGHDEPVAPADDPAQNRYALGQVRLDLRQGVEVELGLPAGARFVHSYTAFESASAIPMLVVVFDPRRPKERRRFVALPVGSGVDESRKFRNRNLSRA